jgi:UDP-N-acetylglucosamine--N-acetylmuramyl-(pentapeptide) pyrophosphoryl-undecaprenol N-acetylglucosamine transferase
MPVKMSECSLVICRAGAITLNELAASGKPSILVPSAYVTANHQEINAGTFGTAGAAVVILEKNATAQKLYDTTRELLSDPNRLTAMSNAARSLDISDATERIVGEILQSVRS